VRFGRLRHESHLLELLVIRFRDVVVDSMREAR